MTNESDIMIHIEYIKDSVIRIEKSIEKRAKKRVETAMIMLISTICLTVLWAILTQVVQAFNW